jgi:Zn-dependent protease
MGWQNRGYSRSDYESEGFGRRVLRWLSSSVALGTYFGIHVRIHMTLILLIASNVLFANARGGMGIQNALTSSVILFGIVLLHEFGHCFAARYVGGDADEVLLWPLGGLAFIRTPQRPWPSFVGTAGGPLVNVAICAITAFGLMALSGFQSRVSFNPLLAFGSGDMIYSDKMYGLISSNTLGYYLWWIYSVSFSLLLFNLLPIFPLDGGRILQTMLWPRFGFFDSMNFACITGMFSAGLMGLVGLVTGQFFLLFLAIAGYMTCYQTRMTLSEQAQAAWKILIIVATAPTSRKNRSATDATTIFHGAT